MQRDMEFNSSSRRLSHEAYTVGWICALPLELTAARSMLDEEHESLANPPGDHNVYLLGKIHRHNVVIVCLPAGIYGTNSAAVVASHLQSTFRSISVSLLVGIGGGIPQDDHDIRLGDIVVGIPTSEHPAVIQYDLGKTGQHGVLESKGSLNNPKQALLNAVSSLQSTHCLRGSAAPKHIANALEKYDLAKQGFAYPGSASDVLHEAECEHSIDNSTCDICGPTKIVSRPSRPTETPFIHYGSIASGNQVIKHSKTRDRIVQQHGVLCFEMEAAGIMNQLQCLVVRGICDYCNLQKHKQFQRYAALAAAAYAKELISTVSVTQPLIKENKHGLDNEAREAEAEIIGREARRRLIMQALNFEDAEVRRATVKTAHPQTCRWLPAQKEYSDWLSYARLIEHHGLFWIKGKPGVGKSTIMKFVVEETERNASNETTVISFFFNARGCDLARFTLGMYRSLIYQFFKKNEHLQYLLDGFKMVDVFSQDKLDMLVELFKRIIINLYSQELICFVDALDECPEDQVRDMVKSFEELGDIALAKKIRFLVCFSSRHYPNITVEFAQMIVLDTNPGHQKDLSNYVESELRIGKSKRARNLKQDVLAKSNGLFLWVVLVVKILAREADRGRWHEMETRLNTLPQGLNHLFEDILLRDKQNLAELVLCIQWTLYSERPLGREEFYFALIAAREDLDLKPWDRELITVVDMERYILDCSKGLVEYTLAATPTVQFIHESVREFLSDSIFMAKIDPLFEALEKKSSHQQLSKCCLRQLEVFDTRISFPFLSYAVEYVLGHIDMACYVPNLRARLLHSFPWHTWNVLYKGVRPPDRSLEKLQDSVVATMASFAQTHFYNTAEETAAISDGQHTNSYNQTQMHLPSSILEAIHTGSIEGYAASLVNTALNSAAVWPDTNLLLLTLQDCSVFCSRIAGEAYRKGMQMNCIRTSQLFDPKEGKPSSSSISGGTVPRASLQVGYQAIARLLLGRTSNINAFLADYKTWTSLTGDTEPTLLDWEIPLHNAAIAGDELSFRLLLTYSANDMTASSQDLLPLQTATCQQHIGIVKRFLIYGTNVNISDHYKRTLLHYASWYPASSTSIESIVGLLLQHGSVAGARDDCGDTPLHYIVCQRNVDQLGLRSLILYGADVNAQNNKKETPLHLAALNGDCSTVAFLIEKGAQPYARDHCGNTPHVFARRRLSDDIEITTEILRLLR